MQGLSNVSAEHAQREPPGLAALTVNKQLTGSARSNELTHFQAHEALTGDRDAHLEMREH